MREEELSVVLSVHGLPATRLLVLRVNLLTTLETRENLTLSYQQLVVYSLDHDLLRGVLAHVESQIELLAP